MRTRIIVDSTTDLAPKLEGQVTIVPLTVRFGDKEYIDGVTITHEEFYNKLVESDVLPTTSQATPAAFEEVFKEVAAAGDSAVVITVASQFSGTCQSARIAAEDYDNIYVVDSGSVTMGAGILTEYALRCACSGMEAAHIAELLEKKK